MKVLAHNPRGMLWQNDGNETLQDSSPEFADASAFRVGAKYVKGESGGGGKIGFDLIEQMGEGHRRVEAVNLAGGFNGKGGELGLNIWNGRDPKEIEDRDQIKVAEFRHDEVEFKVPIKAPNLTAQAQPPSRFYTDNQQYCFNFQGGPTGAAMVVYDTWKPGTTEREPDEAKWRPIGDFTFRVNR